MNNLRKEQDKELGNYMEQIKNLAPRIKELLSIEQELNDNLFKYDILCTDCMYHRLGFAKGKDGLGVYGGGCLGEFNLIVDRKGVAIEDVDDGDGRRYHINQLDDETLIRLWDWIEWGSNNEPKF